MFFKEPELVRPFWMKETRSAQSWSLDQVLFKLKSKSGSDPIYLSDVLRGVQVFGSIGSGKTSGAGEAFSSAYLKSGFGGLVLCVKNDEADLWRKRCKSAGRLDDLVVINAEGDHRFNLIESEMGDGTGSNVFNAANLIIEISKLASKSSPKSANKDSFWDDQLKDLVSETLFITKALKGRVTARLILQTLKDAQKLCLNESDSSLSRTPFEVELQKLKQDNLGDDRIQDSAYYFLSTFRDIPSKTRATIIAMFMSVIKPLTLPPFEKLFCTDTNLKPTDAFLGKIIVVDLSVHEFKDVGRLAQVIWKTVFLNAVLSRKNPDRPVFLWVDESQYFAEEKDVLVNTTARSLKCSINYLTQNIPNYVSVLGSRDVVNAIIASLVLKVFHQNTDNTTNQWASESIGRVHMTKTSSSKSRGLSGSGGSTSTSKSESLEFDLQPRAFTNLREGGFIHNGFVDGVIHLPRKLSSGKTWVMGEFEQNRN